MSQFQFVQPLVGTNSLWFWLLQRSTFHCNGIKTRNSKRSARRMRTDFGCTKLTDRSTDPHLTLPWIFSNWWKPSMPSGCTKHFIWYTVTKAEAATKATKVIYLIQFLSCKNKFPVLLQPFTLRRCTIHPAWLVFNFFAYLWLLSSTSGPRVVLIKLSSWDFQ